MRRDSVTLFGCYHPMNLNSLADNKKMVRDSSGGKYLKAYPFNIFGY